MCSNCLIKPALINHLAGTVKRSGITP